MTPTAILPWLRAHLSPRIAATGLVVLICASLSAHAALRAFATPPLATSRQALSVTGYEAEDHFPGAAYLYAADDLAAPASGATGTAALPDLPIPPEGIAVASDDTVAAAQPFSTRLASAIDRGRALECLTAAIYYEAASETEDGQRAVAQVILNRVRHPAFPATVCGVVYQGTERGTGCQFSYACDGSMARGPDWSQWKRALRIAAAALNGSVFAGVGEATHYHTYAVKPSWNRSLVMTAAIGAHFFHRWQGYWGTPQAFRQVYRGGEPVPGPHPRTLIPEFTPSAPTPPVTLAATLAKPAVAPPISAPAPTTIQPAYIQSGTPIAGYKPAPGAPTSAGPDDNQILDRWKDSGKPLQ
ncbi:cell wall hydrolase [Sphingomonas aliaeris]|uniref:Cell wall hydrolase n=1 Tax=Sphingomonas aliaeris TaxID=2759526 RepID=A0A974NT15_9SPHN|nr:cell wall hydrolase [Sphingomonas aliaeris]QQV76381.1 cell wall hydrolase [Sphingomonas aliaeris]